MERRPRNGPCKTQEEEMKPATTSKTCNIDVQEVARWMAYRAILERTERLQRRELIARLRAK